MNLSDPQAGPVEGREGDLGGFEQLEEADKALLPDGFFAGAYAATRSGDGTDNCGAITFFETESETLFSLLPSNWDAAHNGNVEPVAPRRGVSRSRATGTRRRITIRTPSVRSWTWSRATTK